MRVLLILGIVVLVSLAFADHKESHESHDDDHKKGEHKEYRACHKIAPYNTKFYFDLFRHVARDHPSGNMAVSPVFISIALAFMSLGAKHETRSQIVEGLGFNNSEVTEKEIHECFHNLLDILNDDVQLDGGNALFVSKEHNILQTFLDEAKRLYHSEAFSTDFKNTEEAKNQINTYVEKHTHGKIAKLVDDVDQDTVFTLINYIHIRGKWESEKPTTEGDFYVDEKTTVKVPFRTQTGMYSVAFSDDIVMATIPYHGNVSALIIMPKLGKLSELEQNLNHERSLEWRKRMHKQFVEIFIPEFSVSGTTDLKETLRKMGIVKVFSNNADLSGITGEDNIGVSKAIHEAAFSVDEKGTEVARSPAIGAAPMILPACLWIDQPFLITLVNIETRSLLFSARIVNPQK